MEGTSPMGRDCPCRPGLLRFGALISGVIFVSACQYLPIGFINIGEIVAQPAAFEGREVKIRGKIADVTKIPFIEIKSYVLKDETGSILVITQGPLPAIGQSVALRGQVESALILAGQGYGLTVKEIANVYTF